MLMPTLQAGTVSQRTQFHLRCSRLGLICLSLGSAGEASQEVGPALSPARSPKGQNHGRADTGCWHPSGAEQASSTHSTPLHSPPRCPAWSREAAVRAGLGTHPLHEAKLGSGLCSDSSPQGGASPPRTESSCCPFIRDSGHCVCGLLPLQAKGHGSQAWADHPAEHH